MEDNAIVTSVLLGFEPYILIRLTGVTEEGDGLEIDMNYGGGIKQDQIPTVLALTLAKMEEM